MCVHACIHRAGMGRGDLGSQCALTRFALCVYRVCAVFSVHASACSIHNRMSCVSVTLFFLRVFLSCGSESLCKHLCMWPPCTCDLRVSSWILVPGNTCKVISKSQGNQLADLFSDNSLVPKQILVDLKLVFVPLLEELCI